jgi:hypothetical protein
MYPFKYRAVCMGVATAANWTWNFLISFFTPFVRPWVSLTKKKTTRMARKQQAAKT